MYWKLQCLISKNMCSERNKIEAKVITQHISCDCKSKFNSTTCNSNQTWNNKTCQCECKNYCKCKRDYSWKPSTCICENRKYLKGIAECDEIIIVVDTVSIKKTNTVATNIMRTASINCQSKKLRNFAYSFISYHVIIIIVCYYYAKQKPIM